VEGSINISLAGAKNSAAANEAGSLKGPCQTATGDGMTALVQGAAPESLLVTHPSLISLSK
jgi:hypothetical protein